VRERGSASSANGLKNVPPFHFQPSTRHALRPDQRPPRRCRRAPSVAVARLLRGARHAFPARLVRAPRGAPPHARAFPRRPPRAHSRRRDRLRAVRAFPVARVSAGARPRRRREDRLPRPCGRLHARHAARRARHLCRGRPHPTRSRGAVRPHSERGRDGAHRRGRNRLRPLRARAAPRRLRRHQHALDVRADNDEGTGLLVTARRPTDAIPAA